MSVVFVTGEMRSGTSMVAEVLNRLGWQAGITIMCPQPPSWRSDWEDVPLAVALLRGSRPTVEEWRDYIATRGIMARRIRYTGGVCIKSPYLALCLDELKRACPEGVWVRTERDCAEVDASMAEHYWLSQEDQAKIRTALPYVPVPRHVVRYGHAAEDLRALAKALGVVDDVTIEAAVGLIQAPRR